MSDARLVRFVTVGVANTACGLMVIFACKGWLGLNDIVSNLIGYGVGILLGFALHKSWTFKHTGEPGQTLARYLAVLALAYGANLATALHAMDSLGLNSYLAQASGVIPYTVIGYLGSRFFAFRQARAIP